MYFLQLVVNVLWPVIFFRLQWRLFAFFWLVLLFGLVSLTATGFRYIHRTAGRLMIPYQLWLLFAGYLNIGYTCSTAETAKTRRHFLPARYFIPFMQHTGLFLFLSSLSSYKPRIPRSMPSRNKISPITEKQNRSGYISVNF